jgi:phosphoribosylamine--glycine ligase
MKVLVLGSGGREHALVWKLRASPRVTKLYCAPGNGGIEEDAECLAVDLRSVDSMVALAERLQPDLTVVGPELALAAGVVDEFQRRGWKIFGPTKAAAQLESSKSFAKQFMQRHQIPTALYSICVTPEELHEALPHFSVPIVVKADGLAAGKGVVIAQTKAQATEVALEMLSGKMLGTAGQRVVLEEFLEGEELSFLVMSDGERVAPLVAARDHKRVGDGDTGPNTGGMGAYSTPAILDDKMRDWLLTHVARPVVAGMRDEGMEFRGILYCGLMMTARGPMVLEFNCRFGDPETQAILPRLKSDLVDLLEATIDGRLETVAIEWDSRIAVTVVMASGGYPEKYETGKTINGLDSLGDLGDVHVFHAGTRRENERVVTSGGRVLAVTALGETVEQARARAYEAVARIDFEGAHYRRDIALPTLRANVAAN